LYAPIYTVDVIKERKRQVSIGTLNTNGVPFLSFKPAERYTRLSEEIESMQLDIINLQEVHTYRLMRILRANLPSYPYISYERSLWGAKGGLVTFSKLPLEKVSYTSFSNQLTAPISLRRTGLGDKGVLASYLRDLPVAILNTHLTANIYGDWSQESSVTRRQETQIEELSLAVEDAALDRDTVIVVGDFNIPKGTEQYRRFIYRSSASDVFKDEVYPTYHQEYLPPGRESQCIDYIFVFSNKGNVEVDQTSLVFQEPVELSSGKLSYLSDHIGLSAILGI